MTQVFDNVITNAMKYSRGDKRVEFHVKQNPLYNRMTIRIKDTASVFLSIKSIRYSTDSIV